MRSLHGATLQKTAIFKRHVFKMAGAYRSTRNGTTKKRIWYENFMGRNHLGDIGRFVDGREIYFFSGFEFLTAVGSNAM
jgi:hypothetical protein